MRKLYIIIIFSSLLAISGCGCYDTYEDAWDACNSDYNGRCHYLGPSYKVCRHSNDNNEQSDGSFGGLFLLFLIVVFILNAASNKNKNENSNRENKEINFDEEATRQIQPPHDNTTNSCNNYYDVKTNKTALPTIATPTKPSTIHKNNKPIIKKEVKVRNNDFEEIDDSQLNISKRKTFTCWNCGEIYHLITYKKCNSCREVICNKCGKCYQFCKNNPD